MNAQKEALASRRKVLTAIGLTPAVFAALRIQASESPLPAARGLDIARDRLDRISLTDWTKIGRVEEKLWGIVETAVTTYKDQAGNPAGVTIEDGVRQHATELSFKFVLTNLKEFSDDGEHKRTEECAAALGLVAAAMASIAPAKVVDTATYERAFDYARSVLKVLLLAARNDNFTTFGLAC